MRRNAERGVHSLTFTENPAAMGYPSFHDDYWKPLWEALVDTETVLNVHIGSSGRLAITAPDAPMDVMITLQPMNIVQAAADLLWSSADQEVPGPQDRAVRGRHRAGFRTSSSASTAPTRCTRRGRGQDFGEQKPSEVFREHFLTCFISDPVGVKLRHQIGIDNICWEADYPHSDSMWPGAPEELDEVLKTNDVPDDEINKMTYENAMRWYHFDPFTHIRKEQATVGALRKAAEGPRRLHPGAVQARARPAPTSPDFAASAKELTGNKD